MNTASRHSPYVSKCAGPRNTLALASLGQWVWQCPTGQRDVAITILQPGASDGSRVKFLKEVAIMGQFSHPNVISLLGVVTLGEPVSDVIVIIVH